MGAPVAFASACSRCGNRSSTFLILWFQHRCSRPKDSPELIAAYERQLCTYAHILERRHGRHVDRLLLYWTSEARKKDALMVMP